jgi:hypothetical protein
MNLKEWNQHQIDEALGSVNRYFYWLETGRNSEEASENELTMFYILHKGAEHYRKEHNNESE